MNKDKNKASFNWFPGHMAKAKRDLENSLKLVDMIIELRDARIPFASFNDDFKNLYSNKNRLIIFNKADQIKDSDKKKIEKYFSNEPILLIDARDKKNKSLIINKITDICRNKIERNLKKGIKNTEIRSMVIGIPNVGKSTLINTLSTKNSAKVENKPGVTRSLKWVVVDKTIKLLDTPGILSPKLNSENDTLLLSLLGSIKDDIIDHYKCALFALDYIYNYDKNLLKDRYGINNYENIFNEIACAKNIYKNKEIDINKVSLMVINDVRSGKFGKMIWEKIDA